MFSFYSLTMAVHFSFGIPDCDAYIPALLDLVIASGFKFCLASAFPLLQNSDHGFDSVFIDFLLKFWMNLYWNSRADEGQTQFLYSIMYKISEKVKKGKFLNHLDLIFKGWERAYETSQIAKIPHLLYREEWEKKQLQVRHGNNS